MILPTYYARGFNQHIRCCFNVDKSHYRELISKGAEDCYIHRAQSNLYKGAVYRRAHTLANAMMRGRRLRECEEDFVHHNDTKALMYNILKNECGISLPNEILRESIGLWINNPMLRLSDILYNVLGLSKDDIEAFNNKKRTYHVENKSYYRA